MQWYIDVKEEGMRSSSRAHKSPVTDVFLEPDTGLLQRILMCYFFEGSSLDEESLLRRSSMNVLVIRRNP